MLLSDKLQDVILSKVPILLCVHFIMIFSTSLSADTSCRLIDLQAAKAKNNVLENVIAKLKEEENSDISALIENPMCSEKEDLLEKWLINLKKARITLTDELGDLKLDREQLELALASARNEAEELEEARLVSAAVAEELRERLKDADAELTAMTLMLEKQRKEAEDTLTLLAAANNAREKIDNKLKETLFALEAASIDIIQKKQSIQKLEKVEKNNTELRKNLENALVARLAADAAAKVNKEELLKAERQTALLNQQLSEVRKQLGAAEESLVLSQERQKAQLKNVGSRLNQALASLASEERKRRKLEESERKRLEEERKKLEEENDNLTKQAEELANYKSEFFGRLRTVFMGQERVRIVGDRFIFSSEVLFPTGSSELSKEGKAEISNVTEIISPIMKDIPENIDWIIRVDGHTDNIPVSGSGAYKDNWELSQARALSVVKYMIAELGFSESRLAANGFGEYHPISIKDTPEARALNRRIEIKLTER